VVVKICGEKNKNASQKMAYNASDYL